MTTHAPVPSGTTTPALPPLLLPDDEHNRALLAHVHPSRWTNPTPRGRYNLVVIGGGTAGLVSAIGAAGLGAKVALVERHLMGGDCLNYGCVPSKALISAARAAYDLGKAGAFGVCSAAAPAVDFPAVMERMRRLRAGIAHNDSAARFTEQGVDVFLGDGTFVSTDTIEVGGQRLRFARAVIATGARATGLPVPGLNEAGFLTNETVFSLTALPRRLAVIGAGPIGCELSQAFRRFGSEVAVVSLDARLLPREDADAAAILDEQFQREGIDRYLGAKLQRVEQRNGGKVVVFDRGRGNEEYVADEILVAVGRAPNVEGLGLEAAGVETDRTGVCVDDRLRTANPRIFAAGDVCSPYKFTHAADAMARIVIQNALFFGRKKASTLVIPWSTYTSPEIAHVGLYEGEAKERGTTVHTFTAHFRDLDRAILDGETEGYARIHVDARGGRIVGATVVAPHAGDMIGEMAVAMTQRLGAAALSRTIHPYPTHTEVWKRLGDAYMRTRLKPGIKRAFKRFLAWRR